MKFILFTYESNIPKFHNFFFILKRQKITNHVHFKGAFIRKNKNLPTADVKANRINFIIFFAYHDR